MRKLSSLKHRAVHFILAYLLFSVLISVTLASEAKCEYEDANLIWRNTPAYSPDDVKAMAWYKGKGSLIATWLEGKGFVEYPPYIGRLMQIGESGIKIRTANRSDSGTYWISLTLASVDYKIDAETLLEVKVAPSNQCKPRITREEAFIFKSDLPSEGCGTPRLTPTWKHTNKSIIQKQQNGSSFLDLRTNPEPGEYIVCAEGKSADCYQGNISDLCTRYNTTDDVRDPPSDNASTPGVWPIAFVIPLFIVVVLAAVVVVICRQRISCRKLSDGHNGAENDDISLKEVNKSKDSEKVQHKAKRGRALLEIQDYLRELYESLITVPLSPAGEEYHINVSDLYANTDFEKVEFTDLDNGESNISSDTPRVCQPLISKVQAATKQNNYSGHIFIFGDCGSGKSTWCKHLVKCWLQKSDNNDANIQGLNLPDLRNIKILLYVTLQFSDRGLSFQELLKKYLFKGNSTYLEFLMKYLEHHAQYVLIVMDGLDIVRENIKPISELLHHKLMSSCTVIATSRPTSLKLLQDMYHDNIEQLRLFRVCKMTLEGSKAYASKLLESINCLQGKNLKFANFWTFTEHLKVQSLLKVPYICLLLLHVWMENENIFIEVTDVLLHIINYYLRRAMTDHQLKEHIEKAFGTKSVDVTKYITKLNQWPILIQNEVLLHMLSGVAAEIYCSETERKTIRFKILERFWIPYKDGHGLQIICETGLLTESLSLSTNKQVSDLSFFDRIICECFVSIFIALREGKDCDCIVSSGNAIVQNSRIIHMLVQLSPTAGKDIMLKAKKSLTNESTNTMDNEGRNDSNEKFRYSIAKKSLNGEKPILWLQSLMYNDTLHENKLLFLTAALHFSDNLTSLDLENHENNDKLVFWLPVLSNLKTLTLDINNCTLLLCKEWNTYRIRPKLKEVVIKSVHINMCTLGVLTTALGLCAYLEMLEISPAEDCTVNNDILSERSDLTTFSWMQLSERIKNSKKLKALKLRNLNLFGEVDRLLSRLNHYNSLEILELSNLRNSVQEKSSLSYSLGTAEGKDYNDKTVQRINLQKLDLEKLNLLYSPINFIFCTTEEGTTKMVKNNLKVLCMSSVDMPAESWKKLGNQIGDLTLSKVRLENVGPRDSVQFLLDGIGKCEEVEYLSLVNIDISASFCFLNNMKKLSSLHLECMNFAGLSSSALFEGIGQCKKLKTLFFGTIDMEEVPENLCFDLNNLSELTVWKVRISNRSGCLYWLLDAFRNCKNLKTFYLRNVNKADIPSELSAR